MRVAELPALQSSEKPRFFDGLETSEIKAVLAAARLCRFSAGTIVAAQGTPADSLFLIAKGRARFFILTPDGHKILLLWLPEGEVFGAAAMQCRPSDYIVSTETVKDSTVYIWDRSTIRRLAARYPQLLENALLTATEYLTFYVATHVALTCHTAEERVAAVLLNLAQGIGFPTSDGMELNISNEELAEAASVTHFTASRLLSEWQRKGALVKTRGKVLLRFPERLTVSRH